MNPRRAKVKIRNPECQGTQHRHEISTDDLVSVSLHKYYIPFDQKKVCQIKRKHLQNTVKDKML